MGMTIAEKIIAAAAGVESVKPGDIHTVELDRLMSNDGTTHLTVDMYNNKLKNPHIADTGKLVFIVDHNVPSDCPKTAASQKKMRDFAKANHIDFWEGKGVCHQIMMENYVRPGELIFGADSHTCSYGALGAFGTGVGCTDFLYGMVTGTSWVMVPETVKFNLVGKLPEGVYARDLILTIIGEVGANGCNYQVMEFTGEGAKTLTISDRIALCNMAVEAGAKTGIFEVDDVAMEYLKEHGREPKAVYHSDPDAVYAREYTFDLSKVRPVVSCKGTTCQYGLIDTFALSEEIHERFFHGYSDVKLPHKFKIAVGGCPNNCVKPNLNDVGIIGQRIPHFDSEACKGCKKCAIEAACPNKVAKVVDGKLHIDEELCRHCGRCVGKCPFHSIPDGTYGFKIYIGGRWGKKISHGKALNRIFTSEEEALDVIEKAILLFKDQGLKGERFAETIERIGFENAEKQLLEKNLLERKMEILSK